MEGVVGCPLLPLSVGLGALICVLGPDESPLLCYVRVYLMWYWYCLCIFFSLFSLALVPDLFLLYAVIGGWLYFILIKCPNHCICCLSMYSVHEVMPTLLLMSSFRSLSFLVTPTAFLKHFISHVVSFLWCASVRDQVWHWLCMYVCVLYLFLCFVMTENVRFR